MLNTCIQCGDIHIFNYCHKGLQLIKYMKYKEYLQHLTIYQLRWLTTYFKQKRSNSRIKMIDQLATLDIKSRLEECPICYEEMEIDTMVITPCGHAFCDKCIITHIQYYDTCPCCREICPFTYLLLVIPKERISTFYKNIYKNHNGVIDTAVIQPTIYWSRYILEYKNYIICYISNMMIVYFILFITRKVTDSIDNK